MTRVLASLALVGAIGCAPATAELSGNATFDGTPIAEGQVFVVPENGPTAGGPITNGAFSLKGVALGKARIRVEGYRKVNFALTSDEMAARYKEAKKRGDATGIVEPADLFPPTAPGAEQELDLKPGRNLLDFAVAKPKR